MHGKNPSELITMRAFVSLVCGHVGKVHPSLVLGKMENMCMCVQVYFIYFLGSNNSGCKIIHIIRRRFTAIQYPIFYGLPFKKKKKSLLYFISNGKAHLSSLYVFSVISFPVQFRFEQRC